MTQESFIQKKDWLHVIGVGGITTGQLAAAYARQGYFVSGSEENMYEPMASFIKSQEGIHYREGFSFQNLILQTYTNKLEDKNTVPGIILAVGGMSRKNKEILFAQKRNINVYNYPQLLEKNLIVHNNSIVVAGSFGKSTVTSLLVKIFLEAGKKTSYMFGGVCADFEYSLELANADTEVSITEGDEYISSRDDMQSKFFYYSPTTLVLTGYAYDHTDVFKTEADYFENFLKLVKSLPATATLIYNESYPQLQKMAGATKAKTIPYKLTEADKQNFPFRSKLIGDFNRENILAAVAVAKLHGIAMGTIAKALAGFSGIKRRLEIVHSADVRSEGKSLKLTIIDDFASTPGKFKNAVEVLQSNFPQANVVVLFQPNMGSRTPQAVQEFANSIPVGLKELNLLPFPQINSAEILTQQQFFDQLRPLTSLNLNLINDNEQIAENILQKLHPEKENVIAFLSSGSVDDQIKFIKDSSDGK